MEEIKRLLQHRSKSRRGRSRRRRNREDNTGDGSSNSASSGSRLQSEWRLGGHIPTPIMAMRKLELPVFSREDARGWIV